MKTNNEALEQKEIKLFLNYWFGIELNKTELISYVRCRWGTKEVFTDTELMSMSFSLLNKALSLYDHDNMLTVMIKAYPLLVHNCFFEYLKENIFDGWLI